MNYDGANIYSSSNVLINDVQANWNNWGGLGVNTSTNVTLENSIGNYNGGEGFGGFEIRTLFSQTTRRITTTGAARWSGSMTLRWAA